MMLAVSIPALALTLLARRRAARLAGVVAFLGLIATAFFVLRVTGEPNDRILSLAGPLIGGALLVVVIATYGRVSALSWLLGALFFTGLGSVSFMLHAPTGIERVGGLLAVLLAAILLIGGNALSRRTSAATAG
jgi:hypothetical protein